jgi:hypothetical protein
MFSEIVDECELSQNASVSLMFALYFLGYITLLEIMKSKDESFEIGNLNDFYKILDSADQWAHQSNDADVLAAAAAPISAGKAAGAEAAERRKSAGWAARAAQAVRAAGAAAAAGPCRSSRRAV